MNTDTLLETAIDAARLGARLNRSAFAAARHRVESKGAVAANTVTETDRSTERSIRSFIAERYPDHAFLGEESGSSSKRSVEGGGSGPVWIVDPIDGTNNFIHGFPHYAVSVACAQNGEVQVGAVLDVERDELFCAIRGGGAWLRTGDERVALRTTGRSTPEGSLIITGFYYERGAVMRRTLDIIAALFDRGIHGIRRTGSAALDICWVAAARADAFFELAQSPWDFAAAALIAEEAGATAIDCDGEALRLRSNSAIIASTPLGNSILAIVQGR